MTDGIITRELAEVLTDENPDARVSRATAEVLTDEGPSVYVSRIVLEVLEPTPTEARSSRGGYVGYLFHVAGMPWAVCTSQALADALDAEPIKRRKIFGYAHYSGLGLGGLPAVTPIFVGLEQPRRASWELQEVKGALVGSSWSVSIADRTLGHTWVAFGSAGRVGLPGVHHIGMPLIDEDCAFAELAADFRASSGSITVYNTMGGNTWENTVENGDYRINWIGGEAILLSGNVDKTHDPLYDMTVSYRGCFRSRNQHHWIDPNGSSPLLYDVPPSIVGQTCYLWQCLLTDDGTALIGDPKEIRTGRVSSDIKTAEGLTTIQINPILKNLDETFKINTTLSGTLRKYVFYRDAKTDLPVTDAPLSTGQQAHLVLAERDTIARGGATDLWYSHNIWICSPGETRVFDTLDEVRQALVEELMLCTQGDATQRSGDDTWTAYPQIKNDAVGPPIVHSLLYRYFIDASTGYLGQVYGAACEFVAADELSLIAGPLAFLLNLGPVYTWAESAVYELQNKVAPWIFFGVYNHDIGNYELGSVFGILADIGKEGEDDDTGAIVRPPHKYIFNAWMICGSLTTGANTFCQYGVAQPYCSFWGGSYAEKERWRTQYYYEFRWDYDADCDGWAEPADEAGLIQYDYLRSSYGHHEVNEFNLLDNDAGSPSHDKYRLYINPDLDISLLTAGDEITLGSSTDYKIDHYGKPSPRYLKATIDSITDTGGERYIDLVSNPQVVPGYNTPVRYGAGIYWIPALEYLKAGQDPYSLAPIFINTPGSVAEAINLDPWKIRTSCYLKTATLSDAFKTILGDANATYHIDDRLEKTNIVGFTDNPSGDLWSIIDWDSLDEACENARMKLNIQYRIDLKVEFNLQTELWNCCLLHGISHYVEWCESEAPAQWKIRFRYMEPPSVTTAEQEGRKLTESMLVWGKATKENHSNTWIANEVVLKMNFETDKYGINVNIPYSSSFIQGSDSTGKISIETKLCHAEYNTEFVEALKTHFRNTLRYYAQPQWSNQSSSVIDAMYSLAVGKECLVTDRTARHPATGVPGLSDQPAFITKMDIDLGGNCDVGVTYRITPNKSYGWAPAVYIAANSSSKDGTNVITCAVTNTHIFGPSNGRHDHMWFDCYDWNAGSNQYTARDCTCGDYPVRAFELGDTTPVLIGGDGTFTVTSVTTTALRHSNTIVLTDTDSGGGYPDYVAWDTTKAHVVIFDVYDECGNNPCQRKFVWGSNTNNSLGTLRGDPAQRWV